MIFKEGNFILEHMYVSHFEILLQGINNTGQLNVIIQPVHQ